MKKRKVQSVIYYCAENNKKHFLLLQMNKKRNFLWQNVTGGVDEGEDFTQAAIREAKEETNLLDENIKSIQQTQLEYSFTDQWKKNVIEKVFIIHCHKHWEIKIDPTEHHSFKWVLEENISKDSVHYESNYFALLEAMDL
ncbi:MAG: 8-oxo-dGTP pyrophosphatase MutT (NUDIX family) [Bacteriovoracaceae bacterium]|jgi:8-oxo-dGTP pyrophosphatase MutT (NUDIX family)